MGQATTEQLVGLHRVVVVGVEPEKALALLFDGPLDPLAQAIAVDVEGNWIVAVAEA